MLHKYQVGRRLYIDRESEFPGNPSLQNALIFWNMLILRAAHRLALCGTWLVLVAPGDPLCVLSHGRSWEFCSSPRWGTSPPLPNSAARFNRLHLSLLHLTRTPSMWSSSCSATQLFTQGLSLLKVHRNGPHDPLCFHLPSFSLPPLLFPSRLPSHILFLLGSAGHLLPTQLSAPTSWFCNSTSQCCGMWGGSGLPFWFQRTPRTQERMQWPPMSHQPRAQHLSYWDFSEGFLQEMAVGHLSKNQPIERRIHFSSSYLFTLIFTLFWSRVD